MVKHIKRISFVVFTAVNLLQFTAVQPVNIYLEFFKTFVEFRDIFECNLGVC